MKSLQERLAIHGGAPVRAALLPYGRQTIDEEDIAAVAEASNQPLFWGGAEALKDAIKHRILSADLRQKLCGLTSWDVIQPLHQRFQEKAHEPSILNWMTYLDLNMRLPELLLMRVGKMTMGASLEARVPFLDHKVVELSMSLPTPVKLKGGTLKYILKKAIRGIVPDTVFDRGKQGFSASIDGWILGALRQGIRQHVAEFCNESGLLDPQETLTLIDQRPLMPAWVLLNLALWWQQYIR
jgi:asparagine synthase (glutamine-hydrolysing)